MKLEKKYHSILGCEVWRLTQRYIDSSGEERFAQTKLAMPTHELELSDYGRSFQCVRLLDARAAIREFIARDSK